jgi:hypothetical protein
MNSWKAKLVRARKMHQGPAGFWLTMGFTLCYVSLLVLIPLSTILLKSTTWSWAYSGARYSRPRACVLPSEPWSVTAWCAAQCGLRFPGDLGAGALSVSGQTIAE